MLLYFWLRNDFQLHTSFVACRNAGKCYHLEINPFLKPKLIHNTNHLDGKHILLQVFTNL